MFPTYDTKINTVLTALKTKQAIYFSMYGKYWQGLPTNNIIPTASVSIQNTLAKAIGVNWSWKDIGLNGIKFPFSIEVHEYVAPNNQKGYEVRFFANDGVNDYIKTIGYGVESLIRTQDWIKIKNNGIS
jgi:hypothetical protein